MFYQIRRHLSSYMSILLGAIMLLALVILSSSVAFAAPANEHLEACSLDLSSSLVGPMEFANPGEEFDARLNAELEATRCAVAEMVPSLGHGLELFISQESLEGAAQGLDQDLRLSEELSAAYEYVSTYSSRLISEGRVSRQIAAQEGRDARLILELEFKFDQGFDQDLRLGAELYTAREAFEHLNER
jgi:hypothetical protein